MPKATRSERESTMEGAAKIQEFLEAKLPPNVREQAQYFTDYLVKLASRYERYAARREQWQDYGTRGDRFRLIRDYARDLASNLVSLDILSRDDLECGFEPDKLIGQLKFLHKEAEALAAGVQTEGRPRDLAEERWIVGVADMYKNAFRRSATIWGSGSDAKTNKRRGDFYDLLIISRPVSLPQHGKLDPRQIVRVLERKSAKQQPALTLVP